ncbi:pyrroline-5-carboxylate reductase [Candidatus Pelagibacter bacterium]|nr:pyrroline-5-carboxylate reductase [Candidatus Pelagibacter bacterium]
MNLGFLGTGHITSSVIEGIFKSKLKVKKIFISPRNKIIAKKLSKRFKKVTISDNNQQLIDNSKWIFLAITPQVGHKILKKLKFKKTKKIVSFISTINLHTLKDYTKNKNISRVIPLPFIGMKKGPVIIFSSDKKLKFFFKHLGKVFEVKNEKLSKAFWSTSSFMAPYYNLLLSTSRWLISKGIKRKEAEKYTKELFLALSEDSINKNHLSLESLVLNSQTPGGTNAFVLKKLKKTKFYSTQQKALNNVFKKF